MVTYLWNVSMYLGKLLFSGNLTSKFEFLPQKHDFWPIFGKGGQKMADRPFFGTCILHSFFAHIHVTVLQQKFLQQNVSCKFYWPSKLTPNPKFDPF